MKYEDKTILTVLMQWDYCDPKRGTSGDKLFFFDNLKKLVGRVEPFWYDTYLKKKAQLQADLISKAAEVKPELIFFSTYTDQFAFETLDYLKRNYTTFAWFGDDQWRFDIYSSKYAPHFTYISTTDPFGQSRYRKIGIRPILSQWAAHPYSDNIDPLTTGESYDFDVSFVGGRNEFREWFIKRLARQKIHVECFGVGWPNGRVQFEQMERIFRLSRINLNISNSASSDIRFVLGNPLNLARYLISPKRAEQIKARNFEIPLAGGFQLSNYVAGLERYLEIGHEIAVYTSPEECCQQISYYLENEEMRKNIVARSHTRVKNEHTFHHRLQDILEFIWG